MMKRKRLRAVLAMFLCVMMMLSVVSIAASAADINVGVDGSVGEFEGEGETGGGNEGGSTGGGETGGGNEGGSTGGETGGNTGEGETGGSGTGGGTVTPTPTPPSPPSTGDDDEDATYPPIIVDNDGGSVTVTPANPTEGDEVTIRPIPDEGYEVDDVTVLDENGDEVNVRDNGDGTYTFIQPDGTVQISVTFKRIVCDGGADCPSAAYSDLNLNAWYHEATDYVISHGLLTGTGDGIFEPNTPITRGMIVSIFHRMEGSPAAPSDAPTYSDVQPGDWYAETVAWASSEGVVGGYPDGTFKPNQPITREELASMMYRYAEYKGYNVSARADLTVYIDEPEVSAWAYEVMQWANAERLITGVSSNTIEPKADSTRAVAAAVLMRFCENDWT